MLRWLVLAATLLFAGGLALTSLPVLGDDHWWLWLRYAKPDFPATEPYTFSRMPVFTLIATAATHAGAWFLWPRVFVTFFFALHALAFGLFLEKLLEGRRIPRAAFVAAGAVFALQPNGYEVHLWHLLSIHAFGALCVALAFHAGYGLSSVLLATLGLLTYDSFFFLLPGFALLLQVMDPKGFRIRSHLWIPAAILLAIGIKVGLGKMTGFLQVVQPTLEAARVTDGLKTLLRMLWQIHFYKTNWPVTALHWVAIGGLAWSLRRNGLGSRRVIVSLLAIPTLAALPLALNSYPAPRAYYGPQILMSLSLACMMAVWLSNRVPRRGFPATSLLLAAFILAYSAQWGQVLKLKQRNALALARIEERVTGAMSSCAEPCQLALPPPVEGLDRDWVMPRMFWGSFHERIRLEKFPGKRIQVTIRE
jgi:hypothetical protein